jgi:hypothetical protein
MLGHRLAEVASKHIIDFGRADKIIFRDATLTVVD